MSLVVTLRRVNLVLDLFGLVVVLWVPDPGDPGWTRLTLRRGSYSANCNGGVRSSLWGRIRDAFGSLDGPEGRGPLE